MNCMEAEKYGGPEGFSTSTLIIQTFILDLFPFQTSILSYMCPYTAQPATLIPTTPCPHDAGTHHEGLLNRYLRVQDRQVYCHDMDLYTRYKIGEGGNSRHIIISEFYCFTPPNS